MLGVRQSFPAQNASSWVLSTVQRCHEGKNNCVFLRRPLYMPSYLMSFSLEVSLSTSLDSKQVKWVWLPKKFKEKTSLVLVSVIIIVHSQFDWLFVDGMCSQTFYKGATSLHGFLLQGAECIVITISIVCMSWKCYGWYGTDTVNVC